MDGKQQKPYVKLPGRGVRGWVASVSYTSLWMGADHLLQVEGTRISEDYKRFYFKDIKAIIVRRTRKWATTNWILLGLAVLFFGLFGVIAFNVAPSDREGFLIAGGCIAGFFLLIVLINLLLGPTCVCHLRTPVQEEELPSLKRVRTARKALRRIREAVEAVQGPLTEDGRQEIAEQIAKYEGLPVHAITAVDAVARMGSRTPPLLPNAASRSLRWNIALVVALLMSATMELFSVAGFNGAFAIALNGIANLALGGLSIAILARLPAGVGKGVCWARVLVWGFWLGVSSIYGVVTTFRYMMEHPGKQATLVEIMPSMPKSYYVAMCIEAAIYLIWAVVEIVALVRAVRHRVPQPSPRVETVASPDSY